MSLPHNNGEDGEKKKAGNHVSRIQEFKVPGGGVKPFNWLCIGRVLYTPVTDVALRLWIPNSRMLEIFKKAADYFGEPTVDLAKSFRMRTDNNTDPYHLRGNAFMYLVSERLVKVVLASMGVTWDPEPEDLEPCNGSKKKSHKSKKERDEKVSSLTLTLRNRFAKNRSKRGWKGLVKN